MPTLFDALQQKLGQDSQPATLTGDNQTQIQQGLAAKTGKATTPGTGAPAASSVGQQTAQTAGQTQLDQTAQQGAQVGAQVGQAAQNEALRAKTAQTALKASVAQQKQSLATQNAAGLATTTQQGQLQEQQLQSDEQIKTTQLNAAADQKARELASNMSVSLDNIWRDFKQGEQDLAYRKDASQIEQVGFVLAMRDQSYVDELKRVGQERSLDDKISYQDEMTRVVLGDKMDMAIQQLGFKADLNADQRAWDIKLGQMNIDAAITIMNSEIQQQQQQQMISGVATAAVGVAKYAAGSSSSDTAETPTPAGPQGNLVQQAAQNPDNIDTPANQSAADVYNGKVGSMDYINTSAGNNANS